MKMEIHEKLKEISDYFAQKIIDGDYKFIECGKHTAKILVDGKYHFEVWIANDPKSDFRIYEDTFILGVEGFIDFKTQKARLLAWKKIKPKIDNYRKTTLKRQKQKQLNVLKKELEELI